MTKGFNVKQPISRSDSDGIYSLIKDPVKAIRQNLKFLVLTSPGERIRVPSFGVGLRNYLFENNTPSVQGIIRSKILEQASIFMPYITITSIDFDNSQQDSNRIGISISFRSNTSTSFTDILLLETTI